MDCNHADNAPTGIIFAENAFIATFGWGEPGPIKRSEDGVNWQVLDDQFDHDQVAYGKGLMLAGARRPYRSFDFGQTWEQIGAIPTTTVPRRTVYIPYGDGRFFSMHSSGDGIEHQIKYLDYDLATADTVPTESWQAPSVFPEQCLQGALHDGMAYGNQTIVVSGSNATAICYSKDGGETFSLVNLNLELYGQPLWDGSKFWVFATGVAASSDDGVEWQITPMNQEDVRMHVVQYGAGSFVGVNVQWQQWYEKQKFYRSSDGINWTELAASDFVGSHPIRSIAFGQVAKDVSMCNR